jgi:hypothetical protein
MEQCLEALAETTMTTKQKITLLAMVDDFVFGHALREAATDATVNFEFAATQLATGAFPRLAEAFGDGRVDAIKDRFEQGLRALLGVAKQGGDSCAHADPRVSGRVTHLDTQVHGQTTPSVQSAASEARLGHES